MPYWLAITLLVLEFICFLPLARFLYIKGKRKGMYRWRCPLCRSLLLSLDPQEILHGSIEHMRTHAKCTCPEHPDVTVAMRDETGQHLVKCPRSTARRGNGAVSPPEEGSR